MADVKLQDPLLMLLCVSACRGGTRPALSLLILGMHAQRGLQYLVCVSVCLSVCLFRLVGLQATGRLMSDTNSFSATRA